MARKKAPEQVSGQYTAVPHAVLDSPAFTGAPHPAKALLYELMRQHSGRNNGHLQLATGWLKKRGWRSADVIQRAKTVLVARNLIIKTREGGLNMGCDRWALTWISISDYLGLDMRPGKYQPGAWMLFVNDKEKKKKRTVSRNSTVPGNGTGQPITVPENGAKTTLLTVVTIPANGNNVSNHVPVLRSTTKRIVGQPGKSGTGKKSTLATIQP